MDPFADYSDVQSIWRPLTDAEIVVVTARIEQASQLVRDAVPDVDARIAAGTLSVNTVRFIVRDMVERVVVPARFVRQESVTVDDGSQSQTVDASVSSGEMFISPTQLASLQGFASVVGGGAFEIVLG